MVEEAVEEETPLKVLIAGCGYVGTALGLELAAQGNTVWGLRRSAGKLPPPIRPVTANLLEDPLEEVLPQVDRVVYAVAADGPREEAYRKAYVEAPRRLLAALMARGDPVERFIFVSSTAVYGDAGGGWVDETTPCVPENFRGSTVLEGEETVLASTVPGLVLRLGGIYGPGRTRLLDRVREGEARCPGDGPIWSNRIHRDDCAGALAHLLHLQEPHPVYLGVDDAPTPLCQVYRELAVMLEAPEPQVDPASSRDRSNKRCSNRRLRESGYRFRFPTFVEGYRHLMESGA
jgi:nucleoside-diphosphate-sugar epimerase